MKFLFGDASMRLAPSIFLAFAALLGCSGAAIGQIPMLADTLLRPQWLIARTERYVATHATSLSLDYAIRDPSLLGHLQGLFGSTTTLTASRPTRDRLDAQLQLSLPLGSAFRPYVLADGVMLNDAGSTTSHIPGLNNTSAGFLGAGFQLSDSAALNHLGVAVGGGYNRQLNVHHNGLAAVANAAAAMDLAGYAITLTGDGRWYNLQPLENLNAALLFRAARQFEERAVGELELQYDLARSDLYLPRAEEDILANGGANYLGLERRQDHRLGVVAHVELPVVDQVDLAISGTIARQGYGVFERGNLPLPIQRERNPFLVDRRDFLIGISSRLIWLPENGRVELKLDYNTAEQDNIVEAVAPVSDVLLKEKRETNALNDFVSEQILASAIAEHQFGGGDTVGVVGSVGIYRYNTPLGNLLDYDEQSLHAEAYYRHTFSSFLQGGVTVQAFLTHLVYLSGRFSSDNSWNRIFRFAPSVRFRPSKGVRNDVVAEVSANYTEYDFEELFQTVRGRSFRELRLRDSLTAQITSTLLLWVSGELRISERSSFSWAQFAESPLERTRIEGGEAGLATERFSGLQIGIGGKFFRVKSFRSNPQNVLEPYSDRVSLGPTVRVVAELPAGSRIELQGWWEHQFSDSKLTGRTPSLFLVAGLQL